MSEPRAYYNENDPYAAQWLRNLVEGGHIARGDVDERSISDVRPSDIAGYTQCHFFAGIGVWSYALRRAGWPDDRPVWTGSCPCQPFSAAGKGDGFADERHLWPHWFHLISVNRPAIIFGEQVAAKNADPWVDLIQADLEEMDYAFGCIPFPAAGVGAPHIRDRNYWVVRGVEHAGRARSEAGLPESTQREERLSGVTDDASRELLGAGGRPPHPGAESSCGSGNHAERDVAGHSSSIGRVGDTGCGLHERVCGPGEASGEAGSLEGEARQLERGGIADRSDGPSDRSPPTSPINGHRRDADWLLCRDGKWRPVEPGTFPLAHGAPARVGRLRAYGNAIVAQAAQEFIASYLDQEAIGDAAATDAAMRDLIG